MMAVYHTGFQPFLLSLSVHLTMILPLLLLIVQRLYGSFSMLSLISLSILWNKSSNCESVVPSGTSTFSFFLLKGCLAASLGLGDERLLSSGSKKALQGYKLISENFEGFWVDITCSWGCSFHILRWYSEFQMDWINHLRSLVAWPLVPVDLWTKFHLCWQWVTMFQIPLPFWNVLHLMSWLIQHFT